MTKHALFTPTICLAMFLYNFDNDISPLTLLHGNFVPLTPMGETSVTDLSL